jgi:hypothetical protein
MLLSEMNDCEFLSSFIIRHSLVTIYLLSGAPGAIPTRDLPLRRRTLYATELREHKIWLMLNGKCRVVKTFL